MNARTDIHRPSVIIPEAYYLVACLCTPRAGDLGGCGFLLSERELLTDHMKKTGGKYASHEHGGSCHVCGAWFIDHAVYYHADTNVYLNIGFDCAAKMDIGDERRFRNFRTARKDASELKTGKLKAEAILAEHDLGRVWEIFTTYGSDYQSSTIAEAAWKELDDGLSEQLKRRVAADIYTVFSISRNLIRYGSLSEGQVKYLHVLVKKIADVKETQAKWDAEAAASKPVPFEGRQEFTGTIIGKRLVESDYGNTWKVTIKHADGWRVWVTLPSPALGYEVGETIELRANITISDDDPKFAFAKRPFLLSEEKNSITL